jgi:hypothetical protein
MGPALRPHPALIRAAVVFLAALPAVDRSSRAAELLCPGAPIGVEYFCGEDTATGQQVRPGQPPVLQRVAVLDRLINVGNEDFESFSLRATGPYALSFPGTAGALTGSLDPTGEGEILRTLTEGRFPTSGRQYMESVEFGVTFSQPVAAFGFYSTDAGDYGAFLKLDFFLDDVFLWSLLVHNTQSQNEETDAALMFLGIVTTTMTFDRVQFVNVPNVGYPRSPFDAFGFDDLVVADSEQIEPPPVPEPAAAGLVVLASVLYALTRKPRRPTL